MCKKTDWFYNAIWGHFFFLLTLGLVYSYGFCIYVPIKLGCAWFMWFLLVIKHQVTGNSTSTIKYLDALLKII